jgi:hypothetical protein
MSYDADFKHAALTSWPTDFLGMDRDIFDRDKKQIMPSAKKHGYSILGATPGDPYALKAWRGTVHFVRKH